MWKSCKNLIFNKKHRLVRHYVNCKEYTSLISSHVVNEGIACIVDIARPSKNFSLISERKLDVVFFLLKKNNISISLANMEFLRIKIEIRNVFYFLHSLLFIPPKKDRESRVFARQSASKKAHEKDFKGAVTRYIYDF